MDRRLFILCDILEEQQKEKIQNWLKEREESFNHELQEDINLDHIDELLKDKVLKDEVIYTYKVRKEIISILNILQSQISVDTTKEIYKECYSSITKDREDENLFNKIFNLKKKKDIEIYYINEKNEIKKLFLKKAVITLLGMISHTKLEYLCKDGEIEKQFIDIPEDDRAIYKFSEELNQFSLFLTEKHYINTLPLLIDVFKDRDIIPIATQKSKDIQKKTLEFLRLDISSMDKTIIINESNYEEIFQQISECLQKNEYESFIIDLTHGFRHLPILMIINLIIASIKDIDKIEHIFFAKEVISYKKYEIIDLKEYLELAKLSFVLSSFASNYTVGNKMSFSNNNYIKLVDELETISTHILGNSLKNLIGQDSLTDKTIGNINKLIREDSKLETFKIYTDEIIKHLEKIKNLDKENKYTELYKLSQMMKERGYLLNSITLLSESIGFYCVEKLKKIDNSVKEHIELYNSKISSAKTKEGKKKYNLYQLSNHSKNIIKLKKKFIGGYLFNENKNEQSEIKAKILKVLKSEDYKQLVELIDNIEQLRNNLAHGNSSDEISNVKEEITKLLEGYQKIAQIPNEINVEKRFSQIEKEKKEKRKIKEKIIPKGIDAPKEKIDDLTNLFNNR